MFGAFWTVSSLQPTLMLDVGTVVGTFEDDRGLEASVISRENSENITVERFYGVPYAKPPTGKLRWNPPVKMDTWTDQIDGTNKSAVPVCAQISGAELNMSEGIRFYILTP